MKQMTNPLYCVITTRDNDHLDEAFTTEIKSFLIPADYYQIAGYDTLAESIYFMYIEEWKVIRMIEFFIKNDILLEYQKVDNVLNFINADEKYLEVYSDDHNKTVMDNFIFNTISVNMVLDRIIENRNNDSFSLSEIEKTVLGKSF
ncbi:MAG: hypothetical protein NTU51_00820 [Bacteroidetes bacterium]|nr:hypothetical protein [Bacteroidota bacterium]